MKFYKLNCMPSEDFLSRQPQKSLTQPITTSDGNMFHSLADQLVWQDPGTTYNCHNSVRSSVVLNLLEQLETERIIWINEDEPIEDWLHRMRDLDEFGVSSTVCNFVQKYIYKL